MKAKIPEREILYFPNSILIRVTAKNTKKKKSKNVKKYLE